MLRRSYGVSVLRISYGIIVLGWLDIPTYRVRGLEALTLFFERDIPCLVSQEF